MTPNSEGSSAYCAIACSHKRNSVFLCGVESSANEVFRDRNHQESNCLPNWVRGIWKLDEFSLTPPYFNCAKCPNFRVDAWSLKSTRDGNQEECTVAECTRMWFRWSAPIFKEEFRQFAGNDQDWANKNEHLLINDDYKCFWDEKTNENEHWNLEKIKWNSWYKKVQV
jgi:hypothetical protein